MKKSFFLVILIIISCLFIEFGSWSTIQVYQLIKNHKKNTDIKSEMITLDGIRSEIGAVRDGGRLSEDFYEYRAFYGWVKKDISSKNINVINNQRKTKLTK